MNNTFDSKEELYFSWFLEELKKGGYVESWYRFEDVNSSYSLTDGLIRKYIKPMKKVEDKILEQVILKPSIYTPDFEVRWTEKAIGILVVDLNRKWEGRRMEPFVCQDLVSIIETKADFDKNNMSRLANNNIKFVYQLYKVYINMVKLPSLFNRTFTPNRFLATDRTMVARKIKYKNVRTLLQFIKSIQE